MAPHKETFSSIKQQPGKVQSSLTGIASKKSHVSSGMSSAQPAKFSTDTERLQHINSIRKSPVGLQLKRVLDLLFQTRKDLTPEQINEHCYVDIISNKEVFDNLRRNIKVSYDGRRFSYKAKYNVKENSQLLDLIQKFPEGIAVIDLKDAYPTVMEDLQSLKASGEIWLLSNIDSKEDIAYPNNFKQTISVDDDLKQFFRGIELPRDMLDVEKDLQKNGMKPATNTAQRRAMAQTQDAPPKPKTQAKKEMKITKRTKLTNQHLFEELFKGK